MRKEGGCERKRERMDEGLEKGKDGRREEKLKMLLSTDVRSKTIESVGFS